MATDDGVTSKSALVNVRLLRGSVLPLISTFNECDIVKFTVIVYPVTN